MSVRESASVDIRSAISPGVLISGCVHIVDLDAIKSGAGPVWEKIKDGLHARLECILRQRLAPTDFFASVGPTRYIVVTPHSNAEESAITCLRILHELTVTMLGRCEHEQICIERAYEGENGNLRSERFSRQTIAHLASKAQLSDLADGAADASAQSAPAQETKAAQDDGMEISHSFEPIWDSRHEAITTYICRPHATDENGAAIALSELTLKERIKIELSALRVGVVHLIRHLESGERFILGVPLSFETLGSPYGRMEIAGICRNLPAACRQYLAFLITDIPHGVAHSRLTDFVMTLGHFGKIMATVASGTRNFSAYQGLGLHCIAIDFSSPHADPDRTASDIAQLAAAGRSLRVMTMALGIPERTVLSHAYASSIQILHGKCIGAAQPAPKCMTRLRWSELTPHRARRAMTSEQPNRRLAMAAA